MLLIPPPSGAPSWNTGVHGLTHDEHGGGCCGITHLHNFPCLDTYPEATEERRVEWIKKALVEILESEYGQHEDDDGDYDFDADTWKAGIEVVLAGYQTNEWGSSLEAAGFKEVFSFENDNSGNRCHVFYLETNGGS